MRALAVLAVFALACGDATQPVRWTAEGAGASATDSAGTVVSVRVTARAARGWYFYSITQREGGPIPTRIRVTGDGAHSQAGPVRGPEPSRSYDRVFGMIVEKHSGTASFTVPVRIAKDESRTERAALISVRYQACNDTICHSPRTVTLSVPLAAPR